MTPKPESETLAWSIGWRVVAGGLLIVLFAIDQTWARGFWLDVFLLAAGPVLLLGALLVITPLAGEERIAPLAALRPATTGACLAWIGASGWCRRWSTPKPLRTGC